MKDHLSVSPAPQEADIFERSVLFVVNLIKRNFKLLFLAGLLGAIIGVALSFLVKKEYTARAQVLPEFKESKFSGLSSLASLAGFDVSSSGGTEAIRPDLYPNILESTPTLLFLLRQPVTSGSKEKYPSLLNYFQHVEEWEDKKKITAITSGDSAILNFSTAETNLLNNVKSRVNTGFDKKTGIVTIQVEMPDPLVAATVLNQSIQFLTSYVADYRSKKKHDQTEFIKSRVGEANKQLQSAEFALQRYRDNNRNIIMNVAKIEEQKLQSNYLHAQNLRNDLLNQLEQATLSEKEGQPVIQILEPPIVPIAKSSPKRIIYAVIGSIICSLSVIVFALIRNK